MDVNNQKDPNKKKLAEMTERKRREMLFQLKQDHMKFV
jgi:hypothetical protein